MYTKDEESQLSAYDGTPESVQELANLLGKSKRSIIGKLSKMGVYKKPTYLNKSSEIPITKVELVALISAEVGVDLPGLEKAPKEVLKSLLKGLS